MQLDLKKRPLGQYLSRHLLFEEWDPQGKDWVKEQLREAGAVVADSNYESARLCAAICRKMEERQNGGSQEK